MSNYPYDDSTEALNLKSDHKLNDPKREALMKECLDVIMLSLDNEICSFSNVYHEDTVEQETQEIIRFIRYERGISHYWVAIGYDGYIYYYNDDTPKLLLTEIHNVIVDDWKTIVRGMKK